jgi:mono/diheme cytochrome c family protein
MPTFYLKSLVVSGILAGFAVATGFQLLSQEPGKAPVAESVGGSEEKRRELSEYMKGRYLFQKHCVDCHGATGRGNGPFAAELETKPRNFRTGLFKFRTTPFGMLPMNDDLRRTIRSGISGTAMPVFSQLRDDEIDALIFYLQNLSRSWRDPALLAAPLAIPSLPGWFTEEKEAVERIAAGKARFAGLCVICHGEEGKGDGQGAGSLMDAWNAPISPANLAAPHHKSGDSPRDLYRTIATGMNGTPMIGYSALLEEKEIWELVAYVRDLGRAPAMTVK